MHPLPPAFGADIAEAIILFDYSEEDDSFLVFSAPLARCFVNEPVVRTFRECTAGELFAKSRLLFFEMRETIRAHAVMPIQTAV